MQSGQRKGTCANCQEERYIHGRGLCFPCYRDIGIRNQYPRHHRDYTAKDVAQIIEWSEAKLTRVEIAKRLNRTLGSVSSLCSRMGIKNYRRRPQELREGVRRLFRPDRSDSWIALHLGCDPDSVRRYRSQLGLRRKMGPKPREVPRLKSEPAACECWACAAECPTGNQVQKAGWVSRRHPDNNVEIYCEKCFAEYGWPPLVAYTSPDDPQEWADDEVEKLIAWRCEGVRTRDCADRLGRTKASVCMKLNKLRKKSKEKSR